MSAALVRLQIRRDTAAAWTASNPVLAAGEPALETDTGKVKVGDGVRNWTTLPYAADPDAVTRQVPALSSAAPPSVGSASAGTSTNAARADHSHALPSAISVATVSASGNASVGGTLTVGGSLVGGTHTHTASAISDFNSAVSARLGTALKGGTNISVTADGSGAYTISTSQVGLPSLTGNAGKALTTDGSTVAWTSVSGAVASVNGQTGVVSVSASSLPDFPAQSGNAGKFLSTSGTALSWQTVAAIPSQSGNANKALTTNGSSLSWSSVTTSLISDFPPQSGNINKVLSTNGASLFWTAQSGTVSSVAGRTGAVTLSTSDIVDIPSQAGNAGKFLSSSGSVLSWSSIPFPVTSVNGFTGAVTVTPSSISGFDEAVQDSVASLLKAGSNVGLFYDDANNTLTISSTGGGSTATGVSSVNGKTGNVVLDIPTTDTIDARVQAVAPTTLQAGAAITLTPQTNGKVEIAVDTSKLGGGWSGQPQPNQVRITTFPATASSTNGIATFTVAASGGTGAYIYEWSSAPSGTTEFSVLTDATGSVIGATTATLRLEGLTSANHGTSIRVRVRTATAADGEAISPSVQLLSQTTDFRITGQPSNVQAQSGQTIAQDAFSVVAQAAGTPTYQWQTAASATPDTWSNISGATGPTYGGFAVTLNTGETSRQVLYRCRVQFSGATLWSDAAVLTVSPSLIVITQQPTDTIVTSSGVANFSFQYTGTTGTPTVSWQYFLSENGAPSAASSTSRPTGITFSTNGTQLVVTATGFATPSFDARLRFAGTKLFVRGVVTAGGAVGYTNMAQVHIPGAVITQNPESVTMPVIQGLAPAITFFFDFVVPEVPGRTTDAVIQWFRRRGTEPVQSLSGSGKSFTATGLTLNDNNYQYYAQVTAQGAVRQTFPATAVITNTELLTGATPPGALLRTVGENGGRLQVTKASGAPSLSYQWELLREGQSQWESLPISWTQGTNQTSPTTNSFVDLGPATTEWNNAQIRLRYWVSNTTAYLYTAPTLIVVSGALVEYCGTIQQGLAPGTLYGDKGSSIACIYASGSTVLAVEEQAACDYLWRSGNEGKTWSRVQMPTVAGWRAVACSRQVFASGPRWIAVAPRIMTQTTFPAALPISEVQPACAISTDDGQTWTSVAMNADPHHNCAIDWHSSALAFTLVAPNGIWSGSSMSSLTRRRAGVSQEARRYPTTQCWPRCYIERDGQNLMAIGIVEAAAFPYEIKDAGFYSRDGGYTWSALPNLAATFFPELDDGARFFWSRCSISHTSTSWLFQNGDYFARLPKSASNWSNINLWSAQYGAFNGYAALAAAQQQQLILAPGSNLRVPLGQTYSGTGSSDINTEWGSADLPDLVVDRDVLYSAVNAKYQNYENLLNTSNPNVLTDTIVFVSAPASEADTNVTWDVAGIANNGRRNGDAPKVRWGGVFGYPIPKANRYMAMTDNYIIAIVNQKSNAGDGTSSMNETYSTALPYTPRFPQYSSASFQPLRIPRK
jgi:hypothetical protein